MSKLKVLDLFSGIGGFSLGLERTQGFETVAFCEIDPFCQKVLKKHWPDVPIYNDVRTLDYDGAVDVITGGYPCQPFSTAGRRKGQDDDRHLWPAMLRLIQKYRPTWVIGENVAGHISMGLDDVLSDLADINYGARTFIIPACAVDAKHRRDRVWIVANAGSKRRNNGWDHREGGHILQNLLWDAEESKPEWKGRKRWIGAVSQDVADTSSLGQSGSGKPVERCGTEAPREGETGFSFAISQPRIWPIEPNVGRVANGVPKRVDRLRSLGNSVVPQIPEMIGYAILEAHNA